MFISKETGKFVCVAVEDPLRDTDFYVCTMRRTKMHKSRDMNHYFVNKWEDMLKTCDCVCPD